MKRVAFVCVCLLAFATLFHTSLHGQPFKLNAMTDGEFQTYANERMQIFNDRAFLLNSEIAASNRLNDSMSDVIYQILALDSATIAVYPERQQALARRVEQYKTRIDDRQLRIGEMRADMNVITEEVNRVNKESERRGIILMIQSELSNARRLSDSIIRQSDSSSLKLACTYLRGEIKTMREVAVTTDALGELANSLLIFDETSPVIRNIFRVGPILAGGWAMIRGYSDGFDENKGWVYGGLAGGLIGGVGLPELLEKIGLIAPIENTLRNSLFTDDVKAITYRARQFNESVISLQNKINVADRSDEVILAADAIDDVEQILNTRHQLLASVATLQSTIEMIRSNTTLKPSEHGLRQLYLLDAKLSDLVKVWSQYDTPRRVAVNTIRSIRERLSTRPM